MLFIREMSPWARSSVLPCVHLICQRHRRSVKSSQTSTCIGESTALLPELGRPLLDGRWHGRQVFVPRSILSWRLVLYSIDSPVRNETVMSWCVPCGRVRSLVHNRTLINLGQRGPTGTRRYSRTSRRTSVGRAVVLRHSSGSAREPDMAAMGFDPKNVLEYVGCMGCVCVYV